MLRPSFSEWPLPMGWINAAVATWRTRLDSVNAEEEKAEALNNLLNCFSAAADKPAALNAIRESVEIYRRLAQVQPARYEPALAAS